MHLYHLKFLFGFSMFKYLNLKTMIANAIIKIATDSYTNIEGSRSFFCKIINLDIAVIAISSNDVSTHPEDSFENMKALSADKKLPFPYLYDETQEVAKAYDAACTPDFFGFNSELGLQYRGRLNNKRESPTEIRRELYSAMIEIAKSGKGPREQIPSMGCSIKWK